MKENWKKILEDMPLCCKITMLKVRKETAKEFRKIWANEYANDKICNKCFAIFDEKLKQYDEIK